MPMRAAELLAARALQVLDDRGVTVMALAKALDVDRNTVRRHLANEDGDVAPIVRAAQALYDMDASGVALNRNELIAQFDAQIAGGADPSSVLKTMLWLNLVAGEDLWTLPAGFLLQTAALAALRVPGADSELARTLLVLRQTFYDNMTDSFTAGLEFGLRRLGVRPRAGLTARTITIALHSAHDGFVLRRLLDPAAVNPQVAVDAMWAMAESMTEPGLLAEHGDADALEERFIARALTTFRSGQIATVSETAASIGIESKVAALIFADDVALAERCLDRALGALGSLRTLATHRSPTLPLIHEVLRTLAATADDAPTLINAVPATSATFSEVEAFLSVSLVNAADLDCPNPTATAQRLIRDSMMGSVGINACTETLALFARAGARITSATATATAT